MEGAKKRKKVYWGNVEPKSVFFFEGRAYIKVLDDNKTTNSMRILDVKLVQFKKSDMVEIEVN